VTASVDVVEAAFGYVLFAALAGGAVWFVLRRAAAAGVLAPVAVGLGLRVALMVVIHLVSLARDEGGILFLDDRTYLTTGMHIASGWDGWDLINPGAYNYAGTYQFGYQALMGVAFLLVDDIVAGKLVNVLASTATVLLVALISERVWGEQTRVRAAWIAALAPGLIWWSAPLMKEAFAAFLVSGAVLAVLRLGRWKSLIALLATLAGLMLTRVAGAIAVVLVSAIVLIVLVVRHRRELATGRFALMAAAVVVVTVAGLFVLSGGDIGGLFSSYEQLVDRMISRYRDSGAAELPVEMAKAFVSPYPWTFDEATHNWDMGLYPGMWVWYALYPLAAIALWRHRRRPEVLLLAGVVLVFLAINAYSAGFIFRQRSTIDPLIVVLAVGGISSWRTLGLSAAGAWMVVALFAALQSKGDPVTIAAILAGAGLMFLATSRMSRRKLEVSSPPSLLSGLALVGRSPVNT
jgi:hypothetical protein